VREDDHSSPSSADIESAAVFPHSHAPYGMRGDRIAIFIFIINCLVHRLCYVLICV